MQFCSIVYAIEDTSKVALPKSEMSLVQSDPLILVDHHHRNGKGVFESMTETSSS